MLTHSADVATDQPYSV